jgi:hypothetical protein
MIYLPCKIYNVIKINYGGPDTGHIMSKSPQGENAKYLGLQLHRRLNWHKHIFAKPKELGITLTEMYLLLRRK